MAKGLTKEEAKQSDYEMTLGARLNKQTRPMSMGRISGLSRAGLHYDPMEGAIAKGLYGIEKQKTGCEWKVNGLTFKITAKGVKVTGKRYGTSFNDELVGPQADRLASALLERPKESYDSYCSNHHKITVQRTIAPIPAKFQVVIDGQTKVLLPAKLTAFAALKKAGAFKPSSKKH